MSNNLNLSVYTDVYNPIYNNYLYKDYIFEIGNTKIINYVSLSRQEKELRRERIINMSKEKINELT